MAKAKRNRQWDWQSARYADLSCPEWYDRRVPNGFWDDLENHRRYIVWLGRKLKIKKFDDWYRVTGNDFRKNRGHSLLQHYGSPSRVITTLFPNHDWKPWLFRTAPNGFWENRKNRTEYLRWLGKQLGYKKPEDWYAIRVSDFVEHHGITLLSSRLLSIVKELYPKFQWQEWKFSITQRGFWQQRKNRRRYVKWLEGELGVSRPADWYDVTYDDITENHGAGILDFFQFDPMALLREHYHRFSWLPWKFHGRQLKKFWGTKKNRVAYMKWLGKQLKFKKLDDWYSISQKDFENNCGTTFIKTYRYSPSAAVVDCFPQRKWLTWKFLNVPNCFWKNRQNRFDYMKWLGRQLGFKTWEDWYTITKDDYVDNYGSSLLQYLAGSPSRPVMECFSREHDWLPWRFHKTQRGYWKHRKHRLRYMNWLGDQMGYRRKNDWYQLRATDFNTNHGRRLWVYYEGSAVNALLDYRPNTKWEWHTISKVSQPVRNFRFTATSTARPLPIQ